MPTEATCKLESCWPGDGEESSIEFDHALRLGNVDKCVQLLSQDPLLAIRPKVLVVAAGTAGKYLVLFHVILAFAPTDFLLSERALKQLHFIARQGWDAQLIDLLHREPSLLTRRDSRTGDNVMHAACRASETPASQIICAIGKAFPDLSREAINKQNKNGDTPLHVCCSSSAQTKQNKDFRATPVEQLLLLRPDVALVNSANLTPLQVAECNERHTAALTINRNH